MRGRRIEAAVWAKAPAPQQRRIALLQNGFHWINRSPGALLSYHRIRIPTALHRNERLIHTSPHALVRTVFSLTFKCRKQVTFT